MPHTPRIRRMVLDARGREDLDTDGLIDDLDEQEDVPLRDDAGENAGGGGRRLSVGVRHPEVERKQTGLDAEPHGHQPDGDGHAEAVRPLEPECADGGVQVREKKVAGDGVGVDHADEKQTRADEREDHIPHRRDETAPPVARAQQRAGRDGADLDENIPGEDVVRVAQGDERDVCEVDHDPVERAPPGRNVAQDAREAADHAAQHHRREQQRHQRFEHARGDLVAPRGGVVPHHIGVARVVSRAVGEQRRLHDDARRQQEDRQLAGALFARGEGDHRAHQRQDDRKEGEVLDKAHASSPFRRRSIII